MTKFIKYFAFTIFCTYIIIGCKKDEISKDTSLKISFSTDTLFYDTLFTTLGSVTQTLKVYNPHKSDIKITSVSLAGGSSSNFSININGINNSTANNLLLRGNDSLFIFTKVTINPNNISTPFIVKDSIEFITNTNYQKVRLIAYGQNAYFHKPLTGNLQIEIDTNTTLANDKPHVFMEDVVLKNGATLNLNSNTQLHFNNNKGLYIEPNGNLTVNGKLNEEVIFESININSEFKSTPGQWSGIYFDNKEINASINYAIIKNATTALTFNNDSNQNSQQINLTNTIISNNSINSIKASYSNINASNLLITNCGKSMINITKGGLYNFTHCSFGNFWEESNRSTPIVSLGDSSNNTFTNSIIFGDENEELELAKNSKYFFKNCIIKTELNIADTTKFSNCIWHLDAGFKNTPLHDYSLSSGSPAIYAADSLTALNYPTDLFGTIRTDTLPDIGAIEFIAE